MFGIQTKEDGFATVEFALLLPVMLTLFLGGISAFDGNRASAAITRATTTMVDLVTRQTEINDDIRDEMFATVEAIAGRYADGDDFEIIVSSIVNPADDESQVLYVDWSEATDPSLVLSDDMIDELDLPTLPDGDSVIVVQVTTTHSPIFKAGVFHDWTLSHMAVRRPRFTTAVEYDD